MNSKVRASTLSWRWDGQNTATKKTGMGSGNGGCARDTRECRILSGNENSEERELTTAQILKQAGRGQIRNAAASRSGMEFRGRPQPSSISALIFLCPALFGSNLYHASVDMICLIFFFSNNAGELRVISLRRRKNR